MKWLPLNFDILRNPYNWVVVGLMVLILFMSLHLIISPGVSNTPTDQPAS